MTSSYYTSSKKINSLLISFIFIFSSSNSYSHNFCKILKQIKTIIFHERQKNKPKAKTKIIHYPHTLNIKNFDCTAGKDILGGKNTISISTSLPYQSSQKNKDLISISIYKDKQTQKFFINVHNINCGLHHLGFKKALPINPKNPNLYPILFQDNIYKEQNFKFKNYIKVMIYCLNLYEKEYPELIKKYNKLNKQIKHTKNREHFFKLAELTKITKVKILLKKNIATNIEKQNLDQLRHEHDFEKRKEYIINNPLENNNFTIKTANKKKLFANKIFLCN